ncbi:hypothetical protein HCU64_03475 [Methylobacterium sp. C25]|uniref:hypothetical protein n=1 Tax=Methylobacterium sp. C25 TaxID=2721622 RepID=UPI001F40568F|nr:hypothetical protein [Methylobacterium sp. C25]MCE4222801.1 hypothetical protein [Methylobacterium sp. C25]
MKVSVWALALSLLGSAAAAQDKPLVIPQVEGARQGRIVGRAIACGVGQDRTGSAIAANRQRMLATVGAAFTEDRYLPALNEALSFETSLPKPSDTACAKAEKEFEALEAR